ncbi:methyl-accepting chemotaxis protein [Stenotrophomonas sp. MYb238]|uniref:methyl-accepting chemotaxis protein n=1 Tax=Stenotrophomonas sp. MYb238 TaxID=2040281 RepID=UPI0027D2C913|nr:methyl-accepting chemotaxis protein [Stenotrophomonas sp. MYb238]
MPHPRSGSSIVSRLMLGVALIALLSFGVTAAISYWKSSHALLSSSQDAMRNLAGLEAQRVSDGLSEAYDTANTLAATLLLQRQQGILTRPAVSALFKQQLSGHPDWVGMGTLWEPDAFDGADAAHTGDEAHDESGRFMSYWAWSDGVPVTEALRGYDVPGDGDWYLKPRAGKQPVLVEPYSYAINGKQVLMTTVAMPILEDGGFQGVVTVDFALSSLQEHLSKLSPMGEGHVELLSPAGRVLASRDPAEVGKLREDAATGAMLARIAKGETVEAFVPDAAGNVAMYVPIQVGDTAQHFALGVIVPQSLLTRQANVLLYIVVAVGLLAALGLCTALFVLLRRQVVGPLAAAAGVADDIAHGKLDGRIEAARQDEIGTLMRSMQLMQGNLRERLERDAALAAENLRIRTALDDVTTSVMIADADLTIIYANRPLMEMLGKAEQDLRQDLPNFDMKTLVGSNIDVFHKHPPHQRKLLGELHGTHRTQITVGNHVMRQIINPVTDGDGRRLGYVVEWDDRTVEVQVEQEVSRIVAAAASGELSGRITLDGKSGFLLQLSEQLNGLLDSFATSVGQVSTLLGALSHGDLTTRMEGSYQGVFARIRDDANATVDQLTSIVGRIQGASSAINTAAGEIASGNSDLSRRTEQQAANLEETAASMEELTSTVRQNAEHARQANQLAQGAAGVASQGGQVVSQVVTTMADIEASSKKIADIISVIDGIAFQTNILALNAAVEAARAGEQGRGFAVVASEVRMLAQRSAGAAKEIKELIENSVGKVSEGSQLVHQAGTTMGEIVTSVQRVTDIMAEISAASQEQSAGIEQVNQTVTQMDETTQQNAALVEEATAAARSMEEQATLLADAVAEFRTDARLAVSVAGKAPVRAAPPAQPPRSKAVAQPRQQAATADAGDWQEF